MRDQMTRDLLDYWELVEHDGIPAQKPPPEDSAKAARHAHDWFEAVYGTKAFQKPWKSAESFRAAFKQIPQQIMQEEHVEVLPTLPTEVLSMLQKWLVSSASRLGTGQLWPLVKWATVSGPWQLLAGISFVDLPGFGDANAVRNRIAEREYNRADFVCISSRIDRAATDRASLEWLAKAVRDLPEGSCAYVCTKSDDVSLDEVVRDNNLPSTTSRAEAARVRNNKVKEQVRSMCPVNVYTVSARDFARCMGRDSSTPETFLNTDSTEVPTLIAEMVNQVLARKVRQRTQLVTALEAKLQVMESQLRERPGADFNAAALQVDLRMMVSKLEAQLKICSERSQRDLSERRQQLTVCARDAAAEGKRNLSSQAQHYGSATTLHWRRHKSLVDHDGKWDAIDIAEDVTALVLRTLDRHWIVHFNAIPNVGLDLNAQICAEVEGLVRDFVGRLSAWPELKEHAAGIGRAMAAGVSSMLEEEVEDFEAFLQERRIGYAEDVKEAARGQLAVHLYDAKGYAGTGSFQQRKASVTSHLPKVDLRASVAKPSERIKLVADHFGRASRKMIASTLSQARDCYASFWDGQKQRSQKERDTKVALREVLQSELCALVKEFGSAKQCRAPPKAA
mmetsp:Transcript_144006/g.460297  ORF Transcript_144006/g.460297 Transcript_144006/m.460297 type:complete len:621 (+) Transcript_144006:342-2204(+)